MLFSAILCVNLQPIHQKLFLLSCFILLKGKARLVTSNSFQKLSTNITDAVFSLPGTRQVPELFVSIFFTLNYYIMKDLTAKWMIAAGILCLSACTPVNFDDESDNNSVNELLITVGEVNVTERGTSRLKLSEDGSAPATAFASGDKLRLNITYQGEKVQSATFTATQTESGNVTWGSQENTFWPTALDGYELSFMPEGKDTVTLNNGDALPDILSAYTSANQAPSNGKINATLRHQMARLLVNIQLKSGNYTGDDLTGENATPGTVCPQISMKSLHSIARILCNGEYIEDEKVRDIHFTYERLDTTAQTYVFSAIVPASYVFNQFILSVADQKMSLNIPTSYSSYSLEAGTCYTFRFGLDSQLTMAEQVEVGAWSSYTDPLNYSVLPAWTGNIAKTFNSGEGTAASPFEIASGEQLALMAQLINTNKSFTQGDNTSVFYRSAHYKLIRDIDLNELPWTPISLQKEYAFNGTFDGGNHIISGLNVKSGITGSNHAGLFSKIADATIKDLRITGNIIAEEATAVCVGGLAGAAIPTIGANVSNCHFSGTIQGICHDSEEGVASSGGIIGYIKGQSLTTQTTIHNCSAKGYIMAESATGIAMGGGIAGFAIIGTATGCHTSGMVIDCSADQSTSYAGGIIGKAESTQKNESSTSEQIVNFTIDGCTSVNNTIKSKSLTTGQKAYAGGISASTSGKIISSLSYGGIINAKGQNNTEGTIGGIAGVLKKGGEICNSLNLKTVIDATGSSAWAGVAGENAEGTLADSYSDNQEKSGTSPATGKNAADLEKGVDQTLNANREGRGSLFRWTFTPTSTNYLRYWPTLIP